MGALKMIGSSFILAGAAFVFTMIKDPPKSEASDPALADETMSDEPRSTRPWVEPPASYQQQQSPTQVITQTQPNAAGEPQAGTAPEDPLQQLQPSAQAIQIGRAHV